MIKEAIEKIDAIYEEALRRLRGDNSALIYGPSHIVWDDDNYDSAEFCLQNFEALKGKFSIDDLAIVRWSLEELLIIPLVIRESITESLPTY